MTRLIQFLKNLNPFRLVTFDIVDTILRFRVPPPVQYYKTATEMGIENLEQQRLEKCFKKEFRLMSIKYPNYGYCTPDMSWQEWWIDFVENTFCCTNRQIPAPTLRNLAEVLMKFYHTKECWELIEGSDELLQKVRSAGKYVGVISNFDGSLTQLLNEMKLANKFDFILTSYEAGVQKPYGGIFELATEGVNVRSEQSLHIGNLVKNDYLGARNAGWCSLLVSKDFDKAKVEHATHVYDNLIDLLDALETKEICWK